MSMKAYRRNTLAACLVVFMLAASATAGAATDNDLNLIDAAARNDAQIFKMMLEMGANPDALDKGENSALLMAAYHANRDMVRQLLALRVEVNVKGSIGFTPLGAAAMNADPAIVQMLIKAGGRLDVRDDAGNTPLLTALRFQRDANVRALLEAGADADKTDVQGQSPLMVAVQADRPDYVKALLEKRVDLNQVDKQGMNALYVAIFEGHDEIAQKLVAAGANVNRPANGYPPLHWASVMGRSDLLPVLVNAGAVSD